MLDYILIRIINACKNILEIRNNSKKIYIIFELFSYISMMIFFNIFFSLFFNSLFKL